jgi:hypothetical protein
MAFTLPIFRLSNAKLSSLFLFYTKEYRLLYSDGVWVKLYVHFEGRASPTYI